ncbi:NEDD4-binding protein 2 isoform X2 [Scyliorhinus canicula]|uniref:NEDD4-binding protein 2 isoform X2 n=1 Tax=Scyliorhinus canicula TaxID=7830 RepID=UPI0018F45E8C|nr:NEDD4-binding protein 2 isoform X2 [Scyliorhinus canicula]
MPRKRRNPVASSPARPPGLGPPHRISASVPPPGAVYRARAPVPTRASGSSSAAASSGSAGVNKEELLDRMTEMFSHLDPSVVYVVLSECDFKADDAMDSLLVLSDAAEGVTSSSFTGFDHVAAVLSDGEVNSDSNVVMKDHGSNSVVSESTGTSGFHSTQQLDPSTENELEKYSTNANYETGPEQFISYQQYQPFMNRYNSPISQFSRLCVRDGLPQLLEPNLDSFSHMSDQQQTGADDRVSLGHSPFALNSEDCEENLSQYFGCENNIFEKRSEVQFEYGKFTSEAVERPSSNKSSIEPEVAFPSSTSTSSADIWTNQSESNSLSSAISVNIGSTKYDDSEHSSQKYELHSNTVDQEIESSQSSGIFTKVVGKYSGTGGSQISWFRPNKNLSAENTEIFEEPQQYKGTNELQPKSSTLSVKPLANKGSNSNNMQQNTTCFPYWFDVGQNASGEILPKLTNSGEANYPQYSHSVLFTNVPNTSPISWNPWAPEFQPMSMPKTFVTPVAVSPVKPKPRTVSPWSPAGAVYSPDPPQTMRLGANNLHLKPWLNQHAIQQSQTCEYLLPQHMNRKRQGISKVLILMRGLPGSGKSTLASMLVQQEPNGMIFSTDEYFCRNGHYQFDPSLIGEAHQWNQARAKEAMEEGYSPVIIDNTNTQAWEMKPYIVMQNPNHAQLKALKNSYKVVFREPDTRWKFKPGELERRNIHGVSKEKIKIILEHYERHVTISSIMRSSEPKFPETKIVEQFPAESAKIGAMNAGMHRVLVAAGPPAASDCQDLPYSPMPPSTSTEDQSIIKTNEAFSGNLEQCIRPPSDFPCESRKCRTGHDSGNNAIYSKLLNEENIQKVDQTIGSNASQYNLVSHSDIEDVKKEVTGVRTIESEVKTTENTEHLMCHRDNLTPCDDLPTAFSTSIGQRIRRGKRQCGNSTNNTSEKEEVLKLPVEKYLSGENMLIAKELQAIEQSNQNIEPVLLNFVGDWPVAETLQPQDQRKRRTRKTSEQSISNMENLNQSNNLESIILSNSLKEAAGSLFEQKNVEISQETNSPEASKDNFDDLYVLLSNTKNATLESDSENCEELKSLETFEEQSSEASSEKSINKKSWQNRRVGKSCKLALTFTGSSPISADLLEPVPLTTDQMENSIVTPDNSGQDNATQTAPEDFSLLWKIENQKASFTEFKILTGNLYGFKLADLDATQKSVRPMESVPYKLVHDKSTFVDENAFVNKEENLQILSECFKSVPLEDLNDLYEKCNKDVEWATNLLLDSGVKFPNEDPVNQPSVADDKPVNSSSSIAQVSQASPTEKINFGEQSQNDKSASVTNKLPSANKIAEIDSQTTAMKTENNVEYLMSSLEHEVKKLSPDIAAEPVIIGEEIKSTSDASPACNIDCEQFANPSEGCDLGGECNDSVVGNTLLNNYAMCTEGDISVTSDIKILKETNVSLSECIAINETTSSSKSELNSFTENGSENQSSSNRVKVSAEEENEIEENVMQGESTDQDGSALGSNTMQFQTLELYLPPELAIQLNDLFGSVGLDSDYLTPEECVVQMDLHLAKSIHQKWKETILERKKQESLSYQLLLEGSNVSENLKWDLEDEVKKEEKDMSMLKYDEKKPKKKDWIKNATLSDALTAKTHVVEGFPFMDHWSTQIPTVSLRDIMSEEMKFQTKQDQSMMRSLLSTKDFATKLKEKYLLEMFPGIDKHFIMDMYKDNNYSFEQTEQFLKSVFDCDLEATKSIKIHESVQQNEPTVGRNKKVVMYKDFKELDDERTFQDAEFPDYEDFRAEAVLHRRKQQECFSKAAEAHRRDMKPVAVFYAQQGHLHGEKMKEANYRAAANILKRVNVSLLPQNVLDLHGLHVEEAQYHLENVLLDKINEYQQKGGKPYLSVITGRGCHSQGGVARIKPAVIDYLKTHNFRFTEPQQGVVKIKLN